MKHMLFLKQTQLLLYTNFMKEKKTSEISGLRWATTTSCRRPGRLHRCPGNSDWGVGGSWPSCHAGWGLSRALWSPGRPAQDGQSDTQPQLVMSERASPAIGTSSPALLPRIPTQKMPFWVAEIPAIKWPFGFSSICFSSCKQERRFVFISLVGCW